MSVAIVMGSDSDEAVMRQAAEVLDELGICWEMRVISAHRTPDGALEYARGCRARGVEVIVAGAGGAAHLAGVLAAATPLPVIGVPIALPSLSGLDSLLSMVQMPRGVPVATVGIDGARNAGLLAARILGVADERVRQAVIEFQDRLANDVRSQDAALQTRIGD
jgi:5-(carboxyamino)imidazole ribonucleotide mutase